MATTSDFSPTFGSGWYGTPTTTPYQQQLLGGLQNEIQQNQNGAVALSPSNTANYIQQSVANPLMRQFDQSIMPRLNDSYAAVGALMGSRRGFASQQALGNLQSTIGQALGTAQQSNQQLSAQLGLQYNQLGAALTGQSQMAVTPYPVTDYNASLPLNPFAMEIGGWF